MKLEVIIASTRPGRVGLPVGEWFYEFATEQGQFEVEIADLAEINLPFLDEAKHPRLQEYEKEHTKRWSARIAAADAFVIVTPEYNHSMPAPLVNALDFLYLEWNHKPVGFVSYGGISGGTRSVVIARAMVSALKMVPVTDAVHIPFVHSFFREGKFEPKEEVKHGATNMLGELYRLAEALKPLRS